MTVYVDNMRAKFGRMVMCHMIADTDVELHAMADKIGVSRRWWQAPPKHRSHYDIALSKRAAAVAAGAVEITWRQTSCMTLRRAVTGLLGNPSDAEAWVALFRQQRDKLRKRTDGEQAPADGRAVLLAPIADSVTSSTDLVREARIAAEGYGAIRHDEHAGGRANAQDDGGSDVQQQADHFEAMHHA